MIQWIYYFGVIADAIPFCPLAMVLRISDLDFVIGPCTEPRASNSTKC